MFADTRRLLSNGLGANYWNGSSRIQRGVMYAERSQAAAAWFSRAVVRQR